MCYKEIFILKTLKDVLSLKHIYENYTYPQSINEYNFLCVIKKVSS